MIPAFRFLALVLLSLASLVSVVSAEPSGSEFTNTVVLTDDKDEYLLGSHLDVREDATRSLTFDDVVDDPTAFSANLTEAPNFGPTRSAFWFRLRIENKASTGQHWVLHHQDAMYQYLDFWMIDDNQHVRHIAAGSMRPRSESILDVRGHAFDMKIPHGQAMTLYIRGETGYINFMPLKLYTSDRFTEIQAKESMCHGIYIGIFMAMVLYNFFVFGTIRDSSYVHYICYLISLSVLQNILNGTVSALVLAEEPTISNVLFVLAYEATGIFCCLFTYHFLRTTRGERIFLATIIGLSIVTTAIWLIFGYNAWTKAFTATGTLTSLGCMAIGFRHAKAGDKAAIYYVAGYGWFLVCSMIFIATTQGIIPFSNLSFHANEIGGSLEAVFLSLALVHRFKQMKDDKEKAQKHAAIAQAEALAAKEESLNNKQIALDTIQRYSIKLEAEVKARTTELIDTQQKLVASEKMAALGVFTAGMAHEINNPANFVAAGAQNAEYEVQKLQSFVGELLDDDADPDIKGEFNTRFTKIAGAHEVIKTGIKRIESVVRQLRSDHPEGDVGMQPADVVESLESAWRVLSPTVKTHIVLSVQFDARPQVSCMIAEINQVFLALLSNAAHAIEDAVAVNGPDYKGEITLASNEVDGKLVITVSDNGIGIPADKIDKVFDPFFTTKTVGRGAGLGLSMARDVVKKHGGAIEVESDVSQGATFILWLPMAAAIM